MRNENYPDATAPFCEPQKRAVRDVRRDGSYAHCTLDQRSESDSNLLWTNEGRVYQSESELAAWIPPSSAARSRWQRSTPQAFRDVGCSPNEQSR